MKVKLSYEADLDVDYHEISSLINFRKYERIIRECDQKIRCRLKHFDLTKENEVQFLQNLRRILYIDDDVD